MSNSSPDSETRHKELQGFLITVFRATVKLGEAVKDKKSSVQDVAAIRVSSYLTCQTRHRYLLGFLWPVRTLRASAHGLTEEVGRDAYRSRT